MQNYWKVYQHHTLKISIDRISSTETIGNTLDIRLRTNIVPAQPEYCGSWIEIKQEDPTEVIVRTWKATLPGLREDLLKCQITLESFDNNSSVKSTLKADLIDFEAVGFTRTEALLDSIEIDPSNPQTIRVQHIEPTERLGDVQIHIR